MLHLPAAAPPPEHSHGLEERREGYRERQGRDEEPGALPND